MLNFYTGEESRWLVHGETDDKVPVTESTATFISDILRARGVSPADEVAFLTPSLENLHPPLLLEGMQAAVTRILRAVQNQEKILIYGDYDVDGTCSVAILMNFFRDISFQATFYIPDRADEGYGISDVAVEKIIHSDIDLVLTVDCGITAKKQVAALYAGRKETGHPIDVIITDHHQVDNEKLPEALCCINPHRPDSFYPFKNLCGAGIAWKVVSALADALGKPELAIKQIDLAAFATIADIVDLQGENRIIAHFGIEKMNRDPHPGMTALVLAAGVKPGPIDAARIGFVLAPRVNAAGRMGDASRAVKLFTTQQPEKARAYAETLQKTNTARQEEQEKVYREAMETVAKRESYRGEAVTVVWGQAWHHGVIGIVASKLVDAFHKPAFVISVLDGEAVGSGRSLEGFDLFAALQTQDALLTRFGGHAQAGGLSLPESNLQLFRERMNDYAKTVILPESQMRLVQMEAVLGASLLDVETAHLLQQLEPTGQGNRQPMVCVVDVGMIDKKTMTDGKHLRLQLIKDNVRFTAIGFGLGKYIDHFSEDTLDFAGYLEINAWQGRESLQIRLADIRQAKEARRVNNAMLRAFHQIETLDCNLDWLYNEVKNNDWPVTWFVPSRDELAQTYRYAKKQGKASYKIADLFLLSRQKNDFMPEPLGFFKWMVCFLILDELALFRITLLDNGEYTFAPESLEGKVALTDSEIYCTLQDFGERFQ